MKIALVAPTYLPARRANTVQVMKMAQAMTVLGHEVLVLVPSSPPDTGEEWGELAHHYGLQCKFDIEWLPVNPRLRSYDFGFEAVRRARQWGADLLYTRLPQAAALASFLGMPTIYEAHDLPRGILGPWLFRHFLKGSGARRLVVITRALREALARQVTPLPPAPFTIIAPDGVDLRRYTEPPQVFEDLRRREFTAGYTGHLYPGRGVGVILDIASCLPGVTFLLVGGEPADVARVRAEAQSRGLDNVILTGFVPNAELPSYQAACDVLLMPYQRQVAASSGGDIARYLSPMKLFEYLACGRAILSSDLPVLQEILNPENAVLLPPDDSDAWVAALKALKNDPHRREALATQAHKDAQKYSWEARVERILSFNVDAERL